MYMWQSPPQCGIKPCVSTSARSGVASAFKRIAWLPNYISESVKIKFRTLVVVIERLSLQSVIKYLNWSQTNYCLIRLRYWCAVLLYRFDLCLRCWMSANDLLLQAWGGRLRFDKEKNHYWRITLSPSLTSLK